MKSLKFWEMRNLGIEEIGDDMFYLSQLEQLELRQNQQLGELPRNIGYLVGLKKLSLQKCGLKTVPKEIGYLTNLEELDLSENDLTTDLVPNELGLLKKLKTLNLSDNNLTSLPSELKSIGTSLPAIHVSNNGMHDLSEDIGALTGLLRLRASGNNFQTLPSTIGLLSVIEEIDIQDNKLHELPPEMGELKTCKKIEMSNNMVTALPWELGRLSSPPLVILNVKQNPLLVPPGGIINRGTPTVLLWLRKNRNLAGQRAVVGLDYTDTKNQENVVDG